jgi:endoglucanase
MIPSLVRCSEVHYNSKKRGEKPFSQFQTKELVMKRFALVLSSVLVFLILTSTARANCVGVEMCGFNLSGGASGSEVLPGVFGKHYTYPHPSYVNGYGVDRFVDRGANVFRIDFLWERVQRQLFGELDSVELERITATATYLTAKGVRVILNPHNFARYRGQAVGSTEISAAHFADFWGRLAKQFAGNPLVIFDLVNEPHDLSTEQWRDAANAAIAAIRYAGARNLILVPGNGWTGAAWWTDERRYGTSNARVMTGIVDSGNNYAFDVHLYLDSDASGTNPKCVSGSIGVERLLKLTEWLRTNGKRTFVGEIGGSDSDVCLNAIRNLLDHISGNNDVFLGWAWWSVGPWWPKDYFLSLEPLNGQDRPQMKVLMKYMTPSPQVPAEEIGGPLPVLNPLDAHDWSGHAWRDQRRGRGSSSDPLGMSLSFSDY